MPQAQHLSSVIPFAAIERPACPRCKAQMMLVSIAPARARGVDLHTFECAVCNQVLKTFAAYENPMKSKGLASGRFAPTEVRPPVAPSREAGKALGTKTKTAIAVGSEQDHDR
jgi:hypothetical protein